MSLNKFKPDQKKREKGILVELDTRGDRLIGRAVASVGKFPTFQMALCTDDNPTFEKERERVNRGPRASGEELSADRKAELLIEAVVNVALFNWWNVPDDEEKDLPFSRENAKARFAQIPDAFWAALAVAQDSKNFRVDPPANPDADAKNS